MKKKFFLLMLVLATGLFCFGQVELGYTMGGALSGLNFRTENLQLERDNQGVEHNTSRKGNFNLRPSIYGGLAANFKITNGFLIRVKLIYQEKGWKEKGRMDSVFGGPTSFITNFTDAYTLRYFDLPVEFIFLAPAGKTQVYFGAGAYFDHAIAGKFESSAYGTDSTGFINFGNSKASNAFHGNTWDLGASISLGLIFRMGLSLDFSYLAGVTNVLNDRFFFLYNRNRVFRLGITYMIFKK